MIWIKFNCDQSGVVVAMARSSKSPSDRAAFDEFMEKFGKFDKNIQFTIDKFENSMASVISQPVV